MKYSIKYVIKRDGKKQEFNPTKIRDAIHKALIATQKEDGELAKKLTQEVIQLLNLRFKNKNPHVEDIQDTVEEVLMKNDLIETAKAYILYRSKRTELRETKKFLGIWDDLKLGLNATIVLRARYLLRDEHGNILETPRQMMARVAKAIAMADKKYEEDPAKTQREFYEMLINLHFLPNSPTLMNAGTKLGMLSACFVIPIGDSLEEIFDALKLAAQVHKAGGGTGYSFSHLRPKGDIIRSTMGTSSGPVSFMKIFDVMTEVIKQGGKRRGANMGILNVNHPDIIEFITAKKDPKAFRNFNLSVAVTDEFMKAAEKAEEIPLINPRNNQIIRHVNAWDIYMLIVNMAWQTGDPGLIFIDEINRKNPTPKLGRIEATNPCGEVPLLPYESCNLGSINLSKMVEKREINWQLLEETTRKAVHFLDNVIDVNKYPHPKICEMTLGNRKIGLGVMGFAEMLIKMEIPYNSSEAISLAEKIMKFITETARDQSRQLGQKRGSFPNIEYSIWAGKYDALRNATVTTIAPTGTISIIAGTTSGIEPLFAVSYVRNILGGAKLIETNKEFEEKAKQLGIYTTSLISKIAKTGSIQQIPEIPERIKEIFVTALDIDPEWHVKMQAAFQKYTDNAVSKTVNLRRDEPPSTVHKVFQLAYKLKCKGITVYRYGSKEEQTLQFVSEPAKYITVDSEYAGGCPTSLCI